MDCAAAEAPAAGFGFGFGFKVEVRFGFRLESWTPEAEGVMAAPGGVEVERLLGREAEVIPVEMAAAMASETCETPAGGHDGCARSVRVMTSSLGLFKCCKA